MLALLTCCVGDCVGFLALCALLTCLLVWLPHWSLFLEVGRFSYPRSVSDHHFKENNVQVPGPSRVDLRRSWRKRRSASCPRKGNWMNSFKQLGCEMKGQKMPSMWTEACFRNKSKAVKKRQEEQTVRQKQEEERKKEAERLEREHLLEMQRQEQEEAERKAQAEREAEAARQRELLGSFAIAEGSWAMFKLSTPPMVQDSPKRCCWCLDHWGLWWIKPWPRSWGGKEHSVAQVATWGCMTQILCIATLMRHVLVLLGIEFCQVVDSSLYNAFSSLTRENQDISNATQVICENTPSDWETIFCLLLSWKATDMYKGQFFSGYFAPNWRLQPMEIPPSCSTSLAFGPLHQICQDSSTTSYMAELTNSLPLRLWRWVPKTATISISQMARHNGAVQILWQRCFMRQTARWSALLSVKTLVMWSGPQVFAVCYCEMLRRLPTTAPYSFHHLSPRASCSFWPPA